MKLLITAFDPFGGEDINPALEAVKLLDDKIGAVEVIKLEVPTVFKKSIDLVVEKINEIKPDVVLSIGQAGGRSEITVERVAINIDEGRIADNENYQPMGEKIVESGENAYFSNLPIKAMVKEVRDIGLPASISNTAGTYVCNHLMYGVLHHIFSNDLNIRAGFIHVPFIPEQVARRKRGEASMSIEDIKRGLVASILAIEKYGEDIRSSEGKED